MCHPSSCGIYRFKPRSSYLHRKQFYPLSHLPNPHKVWFEIGRIGWAFYCIYQAGLELSILPNLWARITDKSTFTYQASDESFNISQHVSSMCVVLQNTRETLKDWMLGSRCQDLVYSWRITKVQSRGQNSHPEKEVAEFWTHREYKFSPFKSSFWDFLSKHHWEERSR